MERSYKSIESVMAENIGLQFPQSFYRGEDVGGIENDTLYIATQLKRLTMAQRAKACEAYDMVYAEHGRYEANTRLRNFADRCEKANLGVVTRFGG